MPPLPQRQKPAQRPSNNAGLITVQPGTGSSAGIQRSTPPGHRTSASVAMSEEDLAALTTTQEGVQTQVAWEFPSAAPTEVVNLYDR